MKRIIALALVVCSLGAMLCSCNRRLDLYEAYYLDSEMSKTDCDYEIRSSDYNKPSKSYSMKKNIALNKINKPEKSITINGENIPLEYRETQKTEFSKYKMNTFESREHLLVASYRDDTDELVFLLPGNYKYQIATTISNEQELIQASNAVLSNYMDPKGYTIEITTKASYQSTDGFVVPEDGIKAQYEVDYINYIDGVKAGELVRVTVDSDGYLQALHMQMAGEYEDYKDLGIDEEKYNEVLSSEVRAICDIEGYTLTGWSENKILVIERGKLCVWSVVTPQYEGENGHEPIAQSIELLIPVAK